MAPFYGWVSTASRLEPLRGGSLLFTMSGLVLLVATWNCWISYRNGYLELLVFEES